MSALLLDASVLLAAEDPNDAHRTAILRLLHGESPLATIDLAFYEVTNVAISAWRDLAAAERLRERVNALADEGGLIRADLELLASAAAIADELSVSAYDAAYVAAARRTDSRLVSCDVHDLVSRGLADLPEDVPVDHPQP